MIEASQAPVARQSGITARSPSIRYWQEGTTGQRILLVMGFGMRGALWAPQIQGLRSDHRVAYFDHRGIGESPRGDKRFWDMSDMAEDALSVADALGWDTFHLVGVSMGGMVSQELAIRHTDRLKSLTLIATHEGGPDRLRWRPTNRGIRHFLGAQTNRGIERAKHIQNLLYSESYLDSCDLDALASRIAEQAKPASRRTLLSQVVAILRHDTSERLSSLKLPTLIVRPGADLLISPRAGDRLLRRLPHATLLRLDDAGHGAVFSRAEEINDAIRTHVKKAELR